MGVTMIAGWDAIRMALYVARFGTLTRAAQEMGVHHSTVLRQIEALEAQLGAKLFYRHPRGYSLTRAGKRCLEIADRMDQNASEISRAADMDQEVTGELTLTSVPILSGLVTDAAHVLMRDHPGLRLRLVSTTGLLRLDLGEADVALRAGVRPQDPDGVVIPLPSMSFALYASRGYRRRFPQLVDRQITDQMFICTEGDELRASHYRWLLANVPDSQIRMVSADPAARLQAVVRGLGVDFLPVKTADRVGILMQLAPPREAWQTSLWLVTHRDTHRSARVAAAVMAFRELAVSYSGF